MRRIRHVLWREQRARLRLALIGTFLLLPGCLSSASIDPTAAKQKPPASSVVAIFDSGINPYHVAVRVTPERDTELGALGQALGATVLPLSVKASFEESVLADRALWESTQPGVLYRFAGTCMFAISFGFFELPYYPPRPPGAFELGDNHATGAAQHICSDGRSNALLFVQAAFPSWGDDPGPQPDRPFIATSFLAGLRWAADQPWIDVISVSAGFPGNPPDTSPVARDLQELNGLLRRMTANGVLIFFGAGNDPSPPGLGIYHPPWVATVGGVREGRQSASPVMASKPPDFVANISMIGPKQDSTNETEQLSGTSYASPAVAGRAGEMIATLRAAAGVTGPRHAGPWYIPPDAILPGSKPIGPWDVREALNASAHRWTFGDWTPDPAMVWSFSNLSTPVNPILPAAQLGWGFVDDLEAQAATERLLAYARSGGDRTLLEAGPPTDPDVLFMRSQHALREIYWNAKS